MKRLSPVKLQLTDENVAGSSSPGSPFGIDTSSEAKIYSVSAEMTKIKAS